MILLSPRLVCPNGCNAVAFKAPQARPGEGTAEMHYCTALRGLLAPLVPEGMACKVEAVDREDYVGTEMVQRDSEGRPVMAVVTTRDDGTDRIVFAPTAQGSLHG